MSDFAGGAPTPDGKPYGVFLSHAGYGAEKQGIVSQLAKELRDRNITVFLDKDSLEPGKKAPPRMVRAAATAKVVVAVLSPEYLCRTWTLRELEIALAREKSASLEDFQNILEEKFSKEELELVKNIEPEEGDFLPLYFKVTPGECSNLRELVLKCEALSRQFAEWSFSPERYGARWSTALSELKEISGPIYHESTEEYAEYAKRVADMISAKWFPTKPNETALEQATTAATAGPSLYKVYVHDGIRTPNDLKLVKGSELFKLKGNLSLHDRYLMNKDSYPIMNIETRNTADMPISEICQLALPQFAAMSNEQLEKLSQEQADAIKRTLGTVSFSVLLHDRKLDYSCPLWKSVDLYGESYETCFVNFRLLVGESEAELSKRANAELQRLKNCHIPDPDMITSLEENIELCQEGGRHERFEYSYGEMVLVPRSTGNRTYGMVVSNRNGKHALEWNRTELKQWLVSSGGVSGSEFLDDLPPRLLDICVTQADLERENVPSLRAYFLASEFSKLRQPGVLFEEPDHVVNSLDMRYAELSRIWRRDDDCT